MLMHTTYGRTLLEPHFNKHDISFGDIPTLSTWCKFAPGRFVAKSHFSTWCKFAPGRIVLVPTVCRIDGERKSHKISHKILYLNIRPLRLFNIRP